LLQNLAFNKLLTYLYYLSNVEKFLEVEKKIFNVIHSFKYSSIIKLENANIANYIKILEIMKENFCSILCQFEVLFENKNPYCNNGTYNINILNNRKIKS